MSTGTFCETCRKYIDLPDQPVDEKWRCKCSCAIASDGRVIRQAHLSDSGESKCVP